MVFKLQSEHDFVTENATYKVQRCITQTIYFQELWFLRFVHRLMLINISLKFHEDILNGFQVTERKRFCDGHIDSQTDGQTTMAKTICLPTLKWEDIKLSLQTPKLVLTTRPYTYRVCNHVIAVYSEKQAPALRYCLQEP